MEILIAGVEEIGRAGVLHLIRVAVVDSMTQGALAVTAVGKVTERLLPSVREVGNPAPVIVRRVSPLGLIEMLGLTEVAVMVTTIGVPPTTGMNPWVSLTYGVHDVPATAVMAEVIWVGVAEGLVALVFESITSTRDVVGRPVPVMVRVPAERV